MTDDTERAPTGAEYVTENLDRITQGVRALLMDDNGKVRAPFVLLLPCADEGSHVITNLPSTGDALAIMQRTLTSHVLGKLVEALQSGKARVVALNIDGGEDEQGQPEGKVH